MNCEPQPPKRPTWLERFPSNWNIIPDLLLLLLVVIIVGFIILSLIRQSTAEKETPDVQLSLPLSAFADGGAFLNKGGSIHLLGVGGDPEAAVEAQVVALNDKAALLQLPAAAAATIMAVETPALQYFPIGPTPTPTPLGVQISLPRSAFADEGAFLKAGSRINLISVGDVVATTEADVIDIGEKAVLLELSPAAAEDFMTDETPVLKYLVLTPTPTPESIATPTPTIGVQLSLPLSAFADGGAFLKPGGLVSLVGIAGGTVQVTTAARVVELRDGTRPAVMIDVPTEQAPTVQAYMASGTPIFQTIAIPPAPTPDD